MYIVPKKSIKKIFFGIFWYLFVPTFFRVFGALLYAKQPYYRS